jgi:hypothetical protein
MMGHSLSDHMAALEELEHLRTSNAALVAVLEDLLGRLLPLGFDSVKARAEIAKAKGGNNELATHKR